jgi:hypothetical protein
MDDVFNPYGLHAIRIPLAMITYDGATESRKSLSWGAKALYGRLALFLGRPKADAFCNPDLKTMAAAMGTSPDSIGRWLSELIEHGYIERKRRGRGPAECTFLPHPCLMRAGALEQGNSDSAELRSQDVFNSAKLQSQEEDPTPQPCVFDSATLPAQFRSSAVPIPQLCGSPYKEENVQEDVHENIHENSNTDSSLDSHKNRANTSQLMRGMNIFTNEEEDLRGIVTEFFCKAPDDQTLRSIAAALGGAPVSGFGTHLRTLGPQFQVGGKKAPHTWGWFVSTARTFAKIQPQQAPTVDHCRHGLPWGVDCNRPEVNDALTASFDATDDWRPSTGTNGALHGN